MPFSVMTILGEIPLYNKCV